PSTRAAAKPGPAKTKALFRGPPKRLETVCTLLYIYIYKRSHVQARTPPTTRLSTLAVTDRPVSLSALRVTLKIRGRGSWQSRNDYKITLNRIGLKARIALSIRACENRME
ncbi:hypothetical protein TSAR_010375, partial [Trichomalopsis sarcophagae]